MSSGSKVKVLVGTRKGGFISLIVENDSPDVGFRFGVNPFLRYLGILFPGQGEGWVTTFRQGVARVAGPYSHAILAGVMAVIAYRLQRWLQWGRHWEPRFAALPALPWSKAAVLTAALAVGSLMTIARGPLLGGLLGAALIFIGRSPHRRRLLPAAAVGFVVLLPIGYVGLMSYLDVQPGMAMTASQESALYRKVMIERYVDIALDHAALGWGRNTWPKLPGMASIDNYFLLLSLMHGVVATGLLLFLFLWQGGPKSGWPTCSPVRLTLSRIQVSCRWPGD